MHVAADTHRQNTHTLKTKTKTKLMKEEEEEEERRVMCSFYLTLAAQGSQDPHCRQHSQELPSRGSHLDCIIMHYGGVTP